MAGVVQVGKSEDLEKGKLLQEKQTQCNTEQDNKIKKAISKTLQCIALACSNCYQKTCEFCACCCEENSSYTPPSSYYRNEMMMYGWSASQSRYNGLRWSEAPRPKFSNI